MGRPRAYDPQTALERAMSKFWEHGYAGTSLEDISAETGMNRPSLYAAFGDKRALYLKALESYWQLSVETMREALGDQSQSLSEALMRAYDAQLAIYFANDGLPRGCFVIGTAVTEAMQDAEIKNSLAEGFHLLDADFMRRFQQASKSGELKEGADPAALAVLASGILHTIAVRARAGVPRAALRELASKAIKVMCG